MSPAKSSNASLPTRSRKGYKIVICCLGYLAPVLALISAFCYLETHLESFYIFSPDHLHNLAQRAISEHGNETRAVVKYIVGELHQSSAGNYINLEEDWMFNNAGGAMGAMYIIHASEFPGNQHG